MAAIEALAEDSDGGGRPLAGMLEAPREARETAPKSHPVEVREDPATDAYCEFFRRQLLTIDCVEDFLAEIDAG
jgi:hypothetical protein